MFVLLNVCLLCGSFLLDCEASCWLFIQNISSRYIGRVIICQALCPVLSYMLTSFLISSLNIILYMYWMNPLGTVYIIGSNCWMNSCIFLASLSFPYVLGFSQVGAFGSLLTYQQLQVSVSVLILFLPLVGFILSGIYVLSNPSKWVLLMILSLLLLLELFLNPLSSCLSFVFIIFIV